LGSFAELQNRTAEYYEQLLLQESTPLVQAAPTSPSVMKFATPLQDLKTIGVLGKGAFGLVSLVQDPKNSETYALKAIKKCRVVDQGMEEYVVAEKELMQKMVNPFLVNLRATYADSRRLYLLLEVCLGGELFNLLRDQGSFDENTARFYSACVIEGFAYLHSMNIVYRDLKPENLVLDSRGYLKITDFGLSKELTSKFTYTFCGTPDYLAPEVIDGKGHSFGVDWWTLGILMYEMMASQAPFVDHVVENTYKKIRKGHVKFPGFFSAPSKSLILGLLRKKKTRRLGVVKGGANKIRRHDFFMKAPGWSWEALQNQQMAPPVVPKIENNVDLKNFEQYSDSEDEEESSTLSIDEDADVIFDDFATPLGDEKAWEDAEA